jgi:hypothetical protein
MKDVLATCIITANTRVFIIDSFGFPVLGPSYS